jgi:hypothetical protein
VTDHFGVGLSYRLTARHVALKEGGSNTMVYQAAFLPIRASIYF